MIVRCLHLGFLFFLLSLNLSFQWPAKEGTVTSIFGESRGDHFHDGVDIVSPDKKVYPIAGGTLVYLWNRGLFPLEQYPGGGNYAVVKHDGGILSLYLHLEDTSTFKEILTKNDALGTYGNTGRSYGKHLHFSLLKPVERTSINPLAVLPPYPDEKAPEVKGAFIRIGDRYHGIREGASIVLTRHYPLLVEITDSARGKEKLGIYSIKVNFNSTGVLEINFSQLGYSKNGLTFSDKTFQDLFDEKGYYKIADIRYVEGINHLKVTARDYSGNETTKEISFNVNLQAN
ncbi:MAG TPA: M23 family metallopeptidase [Spirochaetes bacterium]|nr:M23 family metallopeptidase [Spirochaetota bacterium]